MNPFGDTRAELAGKLTAGGVAGVTLDPAALPPFVLVDAAVGDRDPQGVGAWPVSIPIKIVEPPPGDAACLDRLEQTLTLVFRALGRAPFNPYTYRAGDRELPAYLVTYPRDVPNPDC